jgi:hypothetical protein
VGADAAGPVPGIACLALTAVAPNGVCAYLVFTAPTVVGVTFVYVVLALVSREACGALTRTPGGTIGVDSMSAGSIVLAGVRSAVVFIVLAVISVKPAETIARVDNLVRINIHLSLPLIYVFPTFSSVIAGVVVTTERH